MAKKYANFAKQEPGSANWKQSKSKMKFLAATYKLLSRSLYIQYVPVILPLDMVSILGWYQLSYSNNEKGSKVEADEAMCPLLSLFCREENRDGDTYVPFALHNY